MKERIFNTYVSDLTMDETVREVDEIIQRRVPTQHVVINASKINLMNKDEELTNIINSCPIINADGASILWAAKKLGVSLKERVTGIDLFEELLKLSNVKKYRIFLFGAKQEVVEKVKQIIEEKYPNVVIAGIKNGYFDQSKEQEIVDMIKESKADMLFVAFSSPKKEFWVNKYLQEMDIPFCMGVGGSFDVVAGVTKRAPEWMQKSGLEWFYRFIQEPGRLFNRYIIGNLKFVLLTYQYKFKRK
ncbi:WecB/TagA/CpsF family glycosyltransferase [Erysipelothrix sp. HDW6A]|uniref:WecB/TagA/CpsF family glycosyltransferase n=1 Tax=Erysipelothrix sp. HDW6A TaxID=2714928 RepID=UPI00196A771B|nr:WecB/TagA/CpsF family glycosyltransferase [Erysipelothrix sp. HDW6A]